MSEDEKLVRHVFDFAWAQIEQQSIIRPPQVLFGCITLFADAIASIATGSISDSDRSERVARTLETIAVRVREAGATEALR